MRGIGKRKGKRVRGESIRMPKGEMKGSGFSEGKNLREQLEKGNVRIHVCRKQTREAFEGRRGNRFRSRCTKDRRRRK